jgi:probable rRNA maturation factor
MEITCVCRKYRVPRAQVEKMANFVMGSEGSRSRVSIAFVDDRTIRMLNRRFLGRRSSTDVIAFPIPGRGNKYLGEVVVSTERAYKEARRRGITFKEELLRYCVHGILHLLGYSERPTKVMWRRQEELLEGFLRKGG